MAVTPTPPAEVPAVPAPLRYRLQALQARQEPGRVMPIIQPLTITLTAGEVVIATTTGDNTLWLTVLAQINTTAIVEATPDPPARSRAA